MKLFVGLRKGLIWVYTDGFVVECPCKIRSGVVLDTCEYIHVVLKI